MSLYVTRALRSAWEKRIVRYFIIGGLCTSLHYGIFVAMYLLMGFHYQVGNVVGGGAALAANFLLNKYVTFEAVKQVSWKEVWRFGAKKCVFYSVGILALHVLVEYGGLEPWLAQLSLIPVFGVLGYLVLKRYVFLK